MKKYPIEKKRERVLTERQEEIELLIRSTLDINQNITTYRQIIDTTGVTQHEIDKIFSLCPDLKAEFTVRRKSLANTAADNIHEIVNNFNHPQNFQASKFVVQTYKNDMDDELVTKVTTEIGFGIQDGNISPVKITFSKKV